MFIGHYAAAFYIRAAAPRLPLWAALGAVELVDIAWSIAVGTGVERAHLDHDLPGNALVLEFMPYTHSLVATGVWAGVAGAASFAAGWGRRVALAAAAGVASHWFLDLVVHRPDLTLAGGETRYGFGLWNAPVWAFLVEVALVVVGVGLHQRVTGERRWGVAALLVALQIWVQWGPAPGSIEQLAWSGLALYLAFPAWAAWDAGRSAPVR